MNFLQRAGYLSLFVTFICGAIQLIVLADLIRNTRHKLPNKAIVMAYISILFFSLYPIGNFIQSIYAISTSPSTFDHTICLYRVFTQCTFSVGKILMCLYYVQRLYQILQGSTYKYKQLPLQIFGIFIIIGFLLPTLFFGVTVVDGYTKTTLTYIRSIEDCDEKVTYNSSFSTIFIPLGIIINFITDLAVSIIILRLYLQRLVLLSAAFDNFQFKSKSHKQKNELFMALIVKTTNLLIICVITEYIILLVPVLSIGLYWMSINHTVNVLCIYLSFGGFNDKFYGKLCCCMENKYCYHGCTMLCFCCCLPKNGNADEGIAVVIVEDSKSGTSKPKTPSLGLDDRVKSETDSDTKL